jgi:hypothetical protein
MLAEAQRLPSHGVQQHGAKLVARLGMGGRD